MLYIIALSFLSLFVKIINGEYLNSDCNDLEIEHELGCAYNPDQYLNVVSIVKFY